MQPTARAQELAVPVRALLGELNELVAGTDQFDPAASARQFVIAGTDFAEFALLPPLVAACQRDAPGVSFVMQPLSDRYPEELLATGATDLVLGVLEYRTGQRLAAETLIDERLVCVVRNEHVLAAGGRINLRQFLANRHVYPSPLGVQDNIVERWLAGHGKSRDIAASTRTYLAAAQMVCDSDLVLSLPERVAQRLAEHFPLSALQPPTGFPRFNLEMVWHPHFEGNLGLNWLQSQIRRVAATLQAR
jgi:DNA-binding transcriptional LysR family regulator